MSAATGVNSEGGEGCGVQGVMRYATLRGTLKTSHDPKVALKRFLICEGAAE